MWENENDNKPSAKNGVLDLEAFSLEAEGNLALDGEWEFYWKKLLLHEDFLVAGAIVPDAYVKVPDVWNNYNVDGEKLPGEGYGTYRLKVKNNGNGNKLGLKIENLSTAYEIYVDGEFVARSGTVADNKEEARAEYKTQAVVFESDGEEFEIIVRVSNFTYARGGFWYSVFMGTDQKILAMKENSSRREMFIFGGIMMMMLYHLANYIFLRKNISILYYILMMLVIAVRIPVTGEYLISTIFPGANIRILVIFEYLTICWAPVTWILFLSRFYPRDIKKSTVDLYLVTAFILSVFTVLTPVKVFTRFLYIYEGLVVLLFIYSIYKLLGAIPKKREGVLLMTVATLVFFGTFINDALYQANIISSMTGGIFGFSAFVIIFIQAYALAAQFSNSFDKVEKLSDELMSLDRLKDEFIANTSHELRTPLNGIINMTTSVLKDVGDTMDVEQLQNLQLVVTSARRLHNLIDDILDMSRLKNGEIKLYRRPVDLTSVAGLVLYEMSQKKEIRNLKLVNSIPSDFPPLDADVERLRQILYNLLGNAVKFTKEGKIEIGADIRGDMAEIWIEDTGCGIKETDLENIFNYFYQSDSAEIRENGGTGLGLAISRKLAELHGGKITVTSVEGKGSRFILLLPLSAEILQDVYVETSKPKSNNQVVNEPKSDIINKAKARYSILVAEDDYVNQRAIRTILEKEDYYIKMTSDGQEVLDELQAHPDYDLLILDIMMPKKNGYQVLEAVRKRFSTIELPVILLTAKARQRDIQAGLKAGANDYIAKPFEAEELKSRVRTLVMLRESVNSLVNSELNFLQAQIKPHFLYNALSVIISLSLREPMKAKELLLDLSDYLRGSFNFENHEGLVSIKSELKTVEAYLAIEKARFGDRLRTDIEIHSDLAFSVPILSIQPLVENAVRHAVMNKVEGGTVKVSVSKEADKIIITVADDGMGIGEDKLDEILKSETGMGVGIRNIDKRMKSIYGHGLLISSISGEGTKVTLIIPT